MKKANCIAISFIITMSLCFSACGSKNESSPESQSAVTAESETVSVSTEPAVEVANNLPDNPLYENAGGISEYNGDKELVYKKDITGDSEDDEILVRRDETNLTITVNDEKALELKDEYADYFSIDYIRINTENEFLVIDEIYDPGCDDTFYLFKYNNQTKQLDFVQDLRLVGTGRIADQIDQIRLDGNRLTISALTQQTAIGGLYFDAVLVFENGRFVAESNEVDNPVGGDNRKDFTCGFDLDFYQSPGSRTKAFSAAKESVVTIEKIFCDASYVYGYFTQGDNAGWMCFDDSQPYYAFKETWHFN